jgi:hypothetical protein
LYISGELCIEIGIEKGGVVVVAEVELEFKFN